VFLAEDPVLGRQLAVKVLPDEFAHDRARRERLLDEARAASALNHPNIVVIHDAGETDGRVWIAMERIEGLTLREWARATESPERILKVIRQVLAALAVAHDAGLIHRDLKPDNLMVRSDGLVKILDFGLARSLDAEADGQTVTMPGVVVGTPSYMSPEQVLGQPAGPSSDLFSLGTILYELLTGRHPFLAGSTVDTMHQILHEVPKPPSTLNPDLSGDFDFVLGKVLSKDPARRHASARDLDNDLDSLECGRLDRQVAAGPAAGSGPQAIAVLPFKNIGGDQSLAYLGVGLADAVITRLSTSPDLVVRAMSSVLKFENQAVDPRRVGQELDVSAVLDASFQRLGDRFRATARLIATPSGRSLWAGKVDVRNDDLFEVQDQVAFGIAEALTARVTAEQGSAPSGGSYVPVPEAYDRRMRAREAIRGNLRESYLAGIEHLEIAVRIDPLYAAAWIDLGRLYHSMIDGGFDSDPAWYSKSEQVLSRALELDPTNPEAGFAWGAHHLVRGNKAEAYRAFCESARRMPNNWIVWHYLAYVFRLSDMLDEAAAVLVHAIQVDPSIPWTYWALVRVHAFRKDEAQAFEWVERTRVRFGNHPRGVLMEALLLSHLDRHQEVVALWERFHDPRKELKKETEFHALWFYVGFAMFQCGRKEEGTRLMLWSAPEAEVDMDAAMEIACGFAHMGETDKAFRALDRAAEMGQDLLSVYRDPARYGPLHGDPRWPAFLQRVERRAQSWKREFTSPLPTG